MAACLGAGVMAQAQGAESVLAADQGTRLHPIAQLTGSQLVPIPASGLVRTPPDWIRRYTLGNAVQIRLGPKPQASRCTAPAALPIANPPAQPRGSGNPSYVGLAVAGPAQLEPMARVTEASREWPGVSAVVAPLFERHARDHGVNASMLARVPMTIDSLYAVERANETVYYFEASKRIPDAGNTPLEDPKGIVRVSVSGWLRHTRDRIVPAGTKGELHWEPADERAHQDRPTLAPLGVVRHGDESIWVMKSQTGPTDTFSLYALGPRVVRTLFTASAAAC
jgi:hypothetical protein